MDSRTRKVWLHRTRAIIWAIVGALSFPLGWANSVVLVWIASLYANVSTDWGNGEAADDRPVIGRLDRILDRIDRAVTVVIPSVEESPDIQINHGPGFVVMAYHYRDGLRFAAVLHPDTADVRADELRREANEARRDLLALNDRR